MQKTYTALLIFAASTFTQTLHAQVGAYLNVNNINAGILTHGDLWWDPQTQKPECEFYKGMGLSATFAGSLWTSGVDAAGQLHISAQTYRQNGNDYWPGPLDANDTITSFHSAQWERVWKIDHTQLDSFRAIGTHTLANTPNAILEWPAKGNPYARGYARNLLTITEDMAPFVDADGDGLYNPLKGDYPDIKGDQMLWWVFSDNGPAHNETNGRSLKIEIHAAAYAYNRPGMLNNIQYYQYQIINKGAAYNNFRVGIWNDIDVGNFENDFVGFDSTYRMAYGYNATSPDNKYYGSATYGYGNGIPITGISIIKAPNDLAAPAPAGSFVALYNDFATDGNPQVDTQYYNFMNAKFKFGQHIHNDFKGYGIKSSGTGPGPDVNYVFPGDPADTSAWSECASQNLITDRRFVVSTSGSSFLAKQSAEFVFALVITDTDANNYCGQASNKKIKSMADSAWYYFYNPPAPLPANVATVNNYQQLIIYPNPAHTTLTIKSGVVYHISPQNIQVIDVLGRVMDINTTLKATEVEIDISKLPSGVYTLNYQYATERKTALFIKQ